MASMEPVYRDPFSLTGIHDHFNGLGMSNFQFDLILLEFGFGSLFEAFIC